MPATCSFVRPLAAGERIMSQVASCPHCGKPHRVEERHLGCTLQCRKCSESFTIAQLEGSVESAAMSRLQTGGEAPVRCGKRAGKKGQVQFLRSTLRGVPGNWTCPFFPAGPLPKVTGSRSWRNWQRGVRQRLQGARRAIGPPGGTEDARGWAYSAPRANAAAILREARAAGNLQHPNIVPIYNAGRLGNSYFIASGFIEGRTLADYLAEKEKLPQQEAATLIQKLALALHYAHRKGVVHRDIKPANVMLDGEGEPLLMDFGMARRDEGDVLQTMEGAAPRHAGLMSPEQHAGQSHLADARSDQWALGVMLYEMLVGRRPFDAPSVVQMAYAVRGTEPEKPGKLDKGISKDLETICLKCLQKEPEKRYASCRELAENLSPWLRDEPITARPIGQAERLWRWCRRNPVIAVLLASVALLLIAVAVLHHGCLLRVSRACTSSTRTLICVSWTCGTTAETALRVANEATQHPESEAAQKVEAIKRKANERPYGPEESERKGGSEARAEGKSSEKTGSDSEKIGRGDRRRGA